MPEHPNAEPIRSAFEAFARGDLAGMQSLVAEDTTWHIPGRGPLAGDHRNLRCLQVLARALPDFRHRFPGPKFRIGPAPCLPGIRRLAKPVEPQD